MSVDARTSVFPYLSDLLAGYLHHDWRLDDDTVEDVIARFVESSHSVDVWATVADIRRFVLYNQDTDAAYGRIFPNEILPPKREMNAAQWLRWLEETICQCVPTLPK